MGQYDEVGPTAAAAVEIALGNDNPASLTWPADPVDPGSGVYETALGWYLSHRTPNPTFDLYMHATVHWAVSGGFQYVP